MKTNICIYVAAMAAVLPCGVLCAATPAQPQQIGISAQAPSFENVRWEEAKLRKLRHAYWLLEQGDRDYGGHRVKAMEEIHKAGEILGVDMHGGGYGGEKQRWSDERLREARGQLKEIVEETGGREHEHIRAAIHEIDRALEAK